MTPKKRMSRLISLASPDRIKDPASFTLALMVESTSTSSQNSRLWEIPSPCILFRTSATSWASNTRVRQLSVMSLSSNTSDSLQYRSRPAGMVGFEAVLFIAGRTESAGGRFACLLGEALSSPLLLETEETLTALGEPPSAPPGGVEGEPLEEASLALCAFFFFANPRNEVIDPFRVIERGGVALWSFSLLCLCVT